MGMPEGQPQAEAPLAAAPYHGRGAEGMRHSASSGGRSRRGPSPEGSAPPRLGVEARNPLQRRVRMRCVRLGPIQWNPVLPSHGLARIPLRCAREPSCADITAAETAASNASSLLLRYWWQPAGSSHPARARPLLARSRRVSFVSRGAVPRRARVSGSISPRSKLRVLWRVLWEVGRVLKHVCALFAWARPRVSSRRLRWARAPSGCPAPSAR